MFELSKMLILLSLVFSKTKIEFHGMLPLVIPSTVGLNACPIILVILYCSFFFKKVSCNTCSFYNTWKMQCTHMCVYV